MGSHSQGLPDFSMQNIYALEEEVFKKNSRIVHVYYLLEDSIVITIHTIYNIKVNDDGSKKMKSSIYPRGKR